MSEVTDVTITAGVPTAGTGTVPTLSKTNTILGSITDTKVTDPDAASASIAAVLRGLLQKTIDSIVSPGQTTASGSISMVPASDWTAAHDAVDSGPPDKIGAKAVAGVSGATLVSAADRSNLYSGIDGVLYVRPHCGLEDLVSGMATITDGSSTSVISAAGSGVKNYITSIIVANTSATAVTVDIRDGTGGSVKATVPVPANTSGVVCNFPVPLGGFTANTAVAADPSTTATSIIVTLLGFKSKI